VVQFPWYSQKALSRRLYCRPRSVCQPTGHWIPYGTSQCLRVPILTLLHVTLLAHRILRCFLDFCKTYAALHRSTERRPTHQHFPRLPGSTKNIRPVRSIVIIITKIRKETVYHKWGLFIVCMGNCVQYGLVQREHLQVTYRSIKETGGLGWLTCQWDLICTVKRFVLNGKWVVCRCCSVLYVLWLG
jgi:hypothetical protein